MKLISTWTGLMDFSTWRYTYQVADCAKREQMSRYTLLFDTGSSVMLLPRIVKTDHVAAKAKSSVLYNLGTQRSGSGADGNSLKPVGPPGAWDNPFPSDIRDTFFFYSTSDLSTAIWINSLLLRKNISKIYPGTHRSEL